MLKKYRDQLEAIRFEQDRNFDAIRELSLKVQSLTDSREQLMHILTDAQLISLRDYYTHSQMGKLATRELGQRVKRGTL